MGALFAEAVPSIACDRKARPERQDIEKERLYTARKTANCILPSGKLREGQAVVVEGGISSGLMTTLMQSSLFVRNFS